MGLWERLGSQTEKAVLLIGGLFHDCRALPRNYYFFVGSVFKNYLLLL